MRHLLFILLASLGAVGGGCGEDGSRDDDEPDAAGDPDAGGGDADADADADADTDPQWADWVSLAGGTYEMGSPEGVGGDDEHPRHTVEIPAFEIWRTEVTVAQYRRCVEEGPCSAPNLTAHCNDGENNWTLADGDDYPVNCVDRIQSGEFCAWLGGRLPSESEWEYAARSEGQDITHPWGNISATCDRAIMDEGLIGDGCGTARSWPVCSVPAGNSEQGLCDLIGNVGEWVADSYFDSYEGAPADGSAWISDATDRAAWRSPGYIYTSVQMRSAQRRSSTAEIATDVLLGFRCARSL